MPSVALIGPPGTGKSTVFALLGGNATRSPLKQGFTADRAMVGVPDPRFERLAGMFFHEALRRMVSAFETRAAAVFGNLDNLALIGLQH